MLYLRIFFILSTLFLVACEKEPPKKPGEPGYQRPNILFILSDDQSWQHTSFTGYPFVKTPHFDKIARKGVYFERAYVSAPTCTASRSSILTGQYPWRLKSAAMLGGEWPDELTTYPQILAQHGYYVGFTGKGWGPGKINDSKNTPDGKSYYFKAKKKYFWQRSPHNAQATSLALFLHHKPKDTPFAFWVGIREPHRPFEKGDAARFKKAKDGKEFLPGFLPDNKKVREDFAAYLEQIEKYDKILGQLIDQLKDYDIFNNTIIVITSDNGMPFGRAKTQNYEYGLRVPLAVYWKGVTDGDQKIEDLISLVDLAPTFLQAAEVPIPAEMNGRSFLDILYQNKSGLVDTDRKAVYGFTERHSYDARPNHLGYPSRAVYTTDYALIHNYFPDRWPSGDRYEEAESYLLWNSEKDEPIEPYFSLATAKRPSFELYDLNKDPDQLVNLALESSYQAQLSTLDQQLTNYLKQTEDPLALTGKDQFSSYPWAMNGPNGLE